MFLIGGGFAYGGLALIRSLHGLRDRMLKDDAGHGGWAVQTSRSVAFLASARLQPLV